MDFKQLEYFVRTAELGSFTRASVELDVAQSALSRQVRQLEIELGRSLLIRNGRGVAPTEAGKRLLEHGRGILYQVARTREEIQAAGDALAGRVAVGLPPSFSKTLTVPLTRACRERLPQAALSITEGLSSALREALAIGRLDVALLYNPAPSPDIDSIPLLEEDFYFVTRRTGRPARRRIALRELALEPLVIPTRPNTIRLLVESALADHGLRPRIALEIDSVAAILDLVADGAGGAVLSIHSVMHGRHGARPSRAAARAALPYEAIPIVQPRLRSKLAMAVSAQRPATPTQQAVAGIIRDMVARLPGARLP
ncbi:LysR substrate-binding domain-containing protein [Pigmentiphaga soli]|uniref:LysR substrate-binding domain-containing protein n=1 Tax=Pigmentiphaga soli TaxID=1007095 RepID=UPI0031E612C9